MAGSRRRCPGYRRSCPVASSWTCCCKPRRNQSPTISTAYRPPDPSRARWTSRRWIPAASPEAPADSPRRRGTTRASRVRAPAPRTTPYSWGTAARPPSWMHRWLAVWRSSWSPWRIPRGSFRAAAARIASIGPAGFLPQDDRRRDVAAALTVSVDALSPITTGSRSKCDIWRMQNERRCLNSSFIAYFFDAIISMCREETCSMVSS